MMVHNNRGSKSDTTSCCLLEVPLAEPITHVAVTLRKSAFLSKYVVCPSREDAYSRPIDTLLLLLDLPAPVRKLL